MLTPYRERAEECNLELIDDVELPSRILDRNGYELGRIFVENRSLVTIDRVPEIFINALIAQEDQRFFEHKGVDWTGLIRAFYLNAKSKRVNQGASTVTMQLARNAFDLKSEALKRGENGIERKIVEVFLALRIEKKFEGEEGKMKILEFYLNRIPFGKGYYGIRSAALGYYGKEPIDLNLEECASIICCIKNPRYINPVSNPERNKKERNHVFRRMLADKTITKKQYEELIQKPIKLNRQPLKRGKSYLYEKIAEIAREQVGEEALSLGGYQIHTYIDRELQNQAEDSIINHLRKIESREGYTQMRYGDFISGKGKAPKYLQAASLSVESKTGKVLSHVGGRDYAHSQYDIIEHARRPAGTLMFPFLYSAAFSAGLTPATILLDDAMDNRKVMVGGQEGIIGEWGMEILSPTYEMEITARRALAASKIAATVRLGNQIGVKKVQEEMLSYGYKLDTSQQLPRTFLGWDPVSLPEVVRSYSAFTNEGRMYEGLHYIDRIQDSLGKVIYQRPASQGEGSVRAVDPVVASQVHGILKDTTHGGGNVSDQLEKIPYSFGGAVKTGLPYAFSDGWSVAYQSEVTSACWVGFLQGRKAIYPMAFAKDTALPVTLDLVRKIEDLYPSQTIERSRDLKEVLICKHSGKKATKYCEEKIERVDGSRVYQTTSYPELFRKSASVEQCEVHGSSGLADEDIHQAYGPGKAKKLEHLPVLSITPVSMKQPSILGGDPYQSQGVNDEEPAVATPLSSESFLIIDTVKGEKESAIRLPLPASKKQYRIPSL